MADIEAMEIKETTRNTDAPKKTEWEDSQSDLSRNSVLNNSVRSVNDQEMT